MLIWAPDPASAITEADRRAEGADRGGVLQRDARIALRAEDSSSVIVSPRRWTENVGRANSASIAFFTDAFRPWTEGDGDDRRDGDDVPDDGQERTQLVRPDCLGAMPTASRNICMG
jgi:hypothetical protein